MEYLDGEGAAASRATIATHLASCAACQAIAAEQRAISEHAQAWTVGSAPASLPPPAGPRGRLLLPLVGAWRPSRVAMAGLTAAAAVVLVASFAVHDRRFKPAATAAVAVPDATLTFHDQAKTAAGRGAPALPQVLAGRSTVARQMMGPASPGDAPRAPMVIRTATLRIVAKEFSSVRATVEGIVSQAGGFVDQLTVTGQNAAARELRGTLRVPSDRMADTLARLRGLGEVVEDTQGSQDVTEQIVDLDARLASARAAEKRLTELLANRTGRLSDVLDVEREITRVRLDIERLDAEKTNMGRRVSYATIAISIAEERGAGRGPLSLAARVRIAFADGLESALEGVTETFLFVLRAGPSLVLWGLVVALVWLVVRRRVMKPAA